MEHLDKIQGSEGDWWSINCFGGILDLNYTIVEYASTGLAGEPAFIHVNRTYFRKNFVGIWLTDSWGIGVEWTIRNSLIEPYYSGVWLEEFSGSTVIRMIGNIIRPVTDSGWYPWSGIECYSGNPLIAFNTIQGFDTGMLLYYVSSGSFVQKNNILNNFIGIDLEGGSPQILENDIQNNEIGIQCWGADPAIHFNNIEGNWGFGVYNEEPGITIDATDNWWGDSTGPYHPVANPGGLGDPVSDDVDFDPWLTSPYIPSLGI